jgi:predicted DNA-binding ArsR family transcriptional regulator
MSRDVLGEVFEASYTIVNHDMVKKLDLVSAYWLCEIISWMKHLRKKGKVDEEGWFYYTQSHIEEKIGVSTQRQNRIIKKLKSVGVMDVERRGVPAKNYYRINYEDLVAFLYGDSPRSIKIIDQALLKQRNYYNNKNNINTIKSKNGFYGTLFKFFKENNKLSHLPSVACREYIKFTIKTQKKQREKHPSQFKQYSDKQLLKQLAQSTEVIDQLVRLDKWDFSKEIKPAIEWAIGDDFWTLQIRSLAQLRKKGKNGETKFTNIFNGWEQAKASEKSAKEREAKFERERKKRFEDPRNPSRPEIVGHDENGRAIIARR